LRALKYFRPDAPRIATICCLMLTGAALNVLKPWPLAFIVDCVLDHKPPPHWFGPSALFNRAALLAGLSTALLLLYLLQGAFAAVRDYLSVQFGLRELPWPRHKIFAWLQRHSPPFRQDALVSLAAMLIVMAWMNIYLTLLSLALLPLVVLTAKSFGPKIRGGAAADRPAANRGWELACRVAIVVIFALGTSAIAWVGAVQVAARHLTVGELLVFLAYLAQIFEPLHRNPAD
jgi:ABC-type multidrug transport system fused ATPase/permease subunit